MDKGVTCFSWRFNDDVMIRYFYCDTLKECIERIKKTYRIQEEGFEILSIQKRDELTNELLKEVIINGEKNLSLIW